MHFLDPRIEVVLVNDRTGLKLLLHGLPGSNVELPVEAPAVRAAISHIRGREQKLDQFIR